ncbi:protein translocase subunit SecF [Candidatus Falkowbacteria bacterium]|nr:protein translocase subunit SecF [Candidatus Falkowbacteria bacterium]
MKLKIIQNRKYNYLLSSAMVIAAIISLLIWGLKPSIDFTGGSLMEIKFNIERPAIDQIQSGLSDLDLGELRVQPAGDRNIILRFKTVDEETHQKILSQLKSKFKDVKNDSAPALTEERFESIGPIIGKELARKAWIAIVLASIAIILYIAFAFRKVSKPVESWKYGVAAVIALVHDILIVVGLFAILGHFAGFEVDSLFITALLTILGFSVHDTIVVFDRTRENLAKHYSADFEAVVNDSINQTIARSINTSLSTLLVLSALYFLGGKSIANFALALIVGITVGTYSSIFVASPLVVTWHNLSKNFKNRK